MGSDTISVVSASVALAALAVATWQARTNARNAERAHTLPVISEIFREFRSQEFRNSMSYLVTKTPRVHGEEGFRSLSREWQENAYRVCYFFDYLGTLTSFGDHARRASYQYMWNLGYASMAKPGTFYREGKVLSQ
jgi:hypothetical protein